MYKICKIDDRPAGPHAYGLINLMRRQSPTECWLLPPPMRLAVAWYTKRRTRGFGIRTSGSKMDGIMWSSGDTALVFLLREKVGKLHNTAYSRVFMNTHDYNFE